MVRRMGENRKNRNQNKIRRAAPVMMVSVLMILLLAAAAWVNLWLFWALCAVYILMAVYGFYQAGMHYIGPFKGLAIGKIVRAYRAAQHKGEIVFYGASNFTFWETMEEDLKEYKVQNHGFGGSDDAALMKYASRILYPYEPKIVVFQTGSNDYVNVQGSDEEKIAFFMKRKKEMFALFHERLPEAKFLVMAGILLPGRAEYLELTKEVNRQLKELCESTDYMTYVDSEDMTYQNGEFDESLFVKDNIHLTPEARIRWAQEYIIPALEQTVKKYHLDSVKK